MNFSPFAGHFAGAIPAIHQFAASGALGSASSAAATNGSSHLDPSRYTHPHHHAGAAAGSGQPSLHHHSSSAGGQSVNIPHFNQAQQLLGKLRGPSASTADAGQMNNKYGANGGGGGGGISQQMQQHYGQYTQEENNGHKHLRVGNSSHSLGLNSMANGTAYHPNNGDQNQEHGHVSYEGIL